MTSSVPRITSPEDGNPWRGFTVDPFTGRLRPRETNGGPRRKSGGSVIRSDGKPACLDCGRPVTRTRGRRDKRPQSRCNNCHARYERNRREGKVQMLLYPWERAAVLTTRRQIAEQLAEEEQRREAR